jgi:hypothetical protein
VSAQRRLATAVAVFGALFALDPRIALAIETKPPEPTQSTENGGKTVKVTQVDPALGGAVADQARCTWVELNPIAVRFEYGEIVTFPFEPVPGSGRFMRVWSTCRNEQIIMIDATPEETAAEVWAQTIAEIPVADFELNPSVAWGAIVNVPNWVYAGDTIQPFVRTGGFAQNRINIRVIPRTMTINWGDGTTQTCDSLGIAYTTVDHPTLLYEQARDPGPANACTHAYKRHSGKQPDGKYPVTMSITWNAQ